MHQAMACALVATPALAYITTGRHPRADAGCTQAAVSRMRRFFVFVNRASEHHKGRRNVKLRCWYHYAAANVVMTEDFSGFASSQAGSVPGYITQPVQARSILGGCGGTPRVGAVPYLATTSCVSRQD